MKISFEELKEIEDAFAYNCASSVGFAEKKLNPIIQFIKSEKVNFQIIKNETTLVFDDVQTFKNWLKKENFDYIHLELRNTNLK